MGSAVAEMPVLMTRLEVADLLRCTPRGLDKMVRRGAFLAPSKIGKLVRWKRDKVLDFIDGAVNAQGVASV